MLDYRSVSPRSQLQALNVMMMCLSPWLDTVNCVPCVFFFLYVFVYVFVSPCFAVRKNPAVILLYKHVMFKIFFDMLRLQDAF